MMRKTTFSTIYDHRMYPLDNVMNSIGTDSSKEGLDVSPINDTKLT
jgi:hypothetical protein